MGLLLKINTAGALRVSWVEGWDSPRLVSVSVVSTFHECWSLQDANGYWTFANSSGKEYDPYTVPSPPCSNLY